MRARRVRSRCGRSGTPADRRSRRRVSFDGVELRLRRRAGAARRDVHRAGRQQDRDRRAVRRRQVDHPGADRAVLRPDRRGDRRRRRRRPRDDAGQQTRAGLGYVEQDSPVLAGTIRENLLLGAPAATDADCERCWRGQPRRRCCAGTRPGWTRRSARTASCCPAASGSGWRSPGRCWPRRRCCCWTSRPPAWTAATSRRCGRRSTPCPAAGP